jgi:hypothetical protein
MGMDSGYPSLRFYPTVEGCAYNEAFVVVVYLRKSLAAASLSLSRSRPIFRINQNLFDRSICIGKCAPGDSEIGQRPCRAEGGREMMPAGYG